MQCALKGGGCIKTEITHREEYVIYVSKSNRLISQGAAAFKNVLRFLYIESHSDCVRVWFGGSYSPCHQLHSSWSHSALKSRASILSSSSVFNNLSQSAFFSPYNI